eukprot:TRINITY_DN7972_c0_g2_i2.p1 TRINITY_DN7972_c0_g2~~TRINITY_DN7972_c0_g2_i2.p1  ORF type:complete len:1135 (+),score=216.90 TRINITY_DN7972_c0_g2_i2:769-4173(+)
MNFNMPKLQVLDLSNNSFSGAIPSFGTLELTSMRLQNNMLTGTIASFFLPILVEMILSGNRLTGAIPNFNMPRMERLLMDSNNLSGTIPNLNYMFSLQTMNLSNNQLSGSIPNFELPELESVILANNKLSGSLPLLNYAGKLVYLDLANNLLGDSLPNFAFPGLKVLNISSNQITGVIPDLTMPRLLHLRLDRNHISGSIPKLLTPLLVEMKLQQNNLSGTIPDVTMPRMSTLDLSFNRLEGEIPDLTMPLLEHMNLENNNLEGSIPNFNMPRLVSLILSKNRLTGTIPIFESHQLEGLFMDTNNLEGNIPVLPKSVQLLNIDSNPTLVYPRLVMEEIFMETNGNLWKNRTGWLHEENVCSWHGVTCDSGCPEIQSKLSLCPIIRLSLPGNKLSGSLSSKAWLNGLRDLEELNLEDNELKGTMPNLKMPELANLRLSGNQLEGVIPNFELSKLLYLSLADNQFTGFGQLLILPSVTIVDLSSNQLQGTLPILANLTSIVRLDVSFNQLNSISHLSLPNLQTLIISNNKLSGVLPDLDLPRLTYLDLSNNILDQPIPKWNTLVNLEQLIVSSNPNLTGPLPEGMDGFNKISSVDIKGTKMHRRGYRILPKTINPDSQYQMLDPSDNYQCPVLANLNISRSNIEISPDYYDFYNCRCLPEAFGLRKKCISCPSSCICETGLELKGCFPSPSLSNLKTIVPCSNPSACEILLDGDIILETPSSEREVDSCIEGYEDHVCSKCKPGFGAQGRSCVECNSSLVYASFIVGPILIACFITYLFKSEASASGKLGILIFHTQTLSVIATAMSNTPAVERSASIPFSVSSIQLPSLSCAFGTTDALTPIAASFVRLPILALIGILSFKATSGHTRDKVVFVVLNLARCMYYPIALETFGVFGCTLFDEGHDTWFLNAWPWISCDPATDEYNTMLSLAIPVFLVFVCGFPVLLFYIIRENSPVNNQSRGDEERKSRKIRFGFLYLPYQKDYQFWGIVATIRLLLFGLVIRIVPYTSLATIFTLLLVLMQGSIWMQYSRNPYMSPEENIMELLSLYTIFFSYFLVLISGFVGNSSWIIGLVIALNAIVLCFLLFKLLGGFITKFFGKCHKVAVMVGNVESPSVHMEQSSMDVSMEMKSVAPTED